MLQKVGTVRSAPVGLGVRGQLTRAQKKSSPIGHRRLCTYGLGIYTRNVKPESWSQGDEYANMASVPRTKRCTICASSADPFIHIVQAWAWGRFGVLDHYCLSLSGFQATLRLFGQDPGCGYLKLWVCIRSASEKHPFLSYNSHSCLIARATFPSWEPWRLAYRLLQMPTARRGTRSDQC